MFFGNTEESGEIMGLLSRINDYFDKIFGAVGSFNILWDLFDILLVALIIYEGIKLIRGSRTFQIVKGIAILIVIYAVVNALNMEASRYLLNMFFENALLILVVLFSPELRNILERFGRKSFSGIPFFGYKSSNAYGEEMTGLINDFCKAAGEMSESKTGALVVFEREVPLSDIIKTGTVIDAKSSPELFNGLFFKNSALHDGAVIIRDGRVYSAGCILPLTQNDSIDSELGTRHRAAIGMSEQSDALIVVVSEETGAISVSVNGELQRYVTRGELRKILLDNLITHENEKNGRSKLGSLFNGADKKNTDGGESNEE